MTLNINRASKLKSDSSLLLPHITLSVAATSATSPSLSMSILEVQHTASTTGLLPLKDIESLGTSSKMSEVGDCLFSLFAILSSVYSIYTPFFNYENDGTIEPSRLCACRGASVFEWRGKTS
jgi:hypothetical protein